MLKLKPIIILFLLCLMSHNNVLLSQNPRGLLNLVQAKLNKANDYKADIRISVDLPYIRFMPLSTKLYFKKKDKFKIATKSIAILPKQGFMQLSGLVTDTNSYAAIFQNDEMLNNVNTTLLNLIPTNDTSDVILAKLWIDTKNQIIVKSLVTTKSSGTIKTEYIYGSQIAYGLPDVIKFSVDVKKFNIPKALAADINTSTSKKVEKKSGEIVVSLKKYEINKGIPDSIFKD